MAENTNSESKDVKENKAIAAIAYLGILFLVPLLAAKDSPFAQYHAKQGLILFIASLCGFFIGLIFGFIPIINLLIWIIIMALIFALFLIGLFNALNGKTKPLPVIGELAKKFNL